jgi:hypothetical protein
MTMDRGTRPQSRDIDVTTLIGAFIKPHTLL